MVTSLHKWIWHIALRYFPSIIWIRKWIHFKLKVERALQRQLEFSGKQNSSLQVFDKNKKRILIPLIETNHYQHLQVLILAKALQLRGAEVKVLICGSCLDGCELKNERNAFNKDVCLDCHFNHHYVAPLFGLDMFVISDFINTEYRKRLSDVASEIAQNYPAAYLYKGVDLVPIVNNSVRRYYYGGVPSDCDAVRFQHLLTAIIGVEIAQYIYKTWSPDTIFNNMLGYSVWEPYYRVFSECKGINIFQISLTQFNFNSILLNPMEKYKSIERFIKYQKHRQYAPISEEERKKLFEMIYMRQRGDAPIFKELHFFDESSDAPQLFKSREKEKKIFLFPNLHWEEGLADYGQLFDNVVSWVLETIELIKDEKNTHLFIKIHPGEKYGPTPSSKTIADYIHERFPVLPNNITIIYPEMKINTYELFPYIDLGVVFNGTVGLELLLREIPVVIVGAAPYGKLGIAHEPLSMGEYRNILTGQTPIIAPDKSIAELFAYFFFIKSCIPWNLTTSAYNDNFEGYTFQSLDDILPGRNKYLDHLCNCILDPENSVIEGWE